MSSFKKTSDVSPLSNLGYNRIDSVIFSLDIDLFTLVTYRMPFLNAK